MSNTPRSPAIACCRDSGEDVRLTLQKELNHEVSRRNVNLFWFSSCNFEVKVLACR
jgi:hypothetical protein